MPVRLNIRQLRQRLHQTQEQFARHFPVDRLTVWRWETGTVSPSPMARATIRALQAKAHAQAETQAQASLSGSDSSQSSGAVAPQGGTADGRSDLGGSS